MSFETILGQGQAKNILTRALEHGTVAHAYLFYGAESIGKKRTAVEFAKALNCAEPGPDGSCGHCSSCLKIDQNRHPDFFLVEPTRKPKSRDVNINIDEVRELQKMLGYMPYEGRYKVAVIDGVEKMLLQACNAFLKTLEEPPASTVLILVTAHLHQLLPTIISRCQGVKFNPLPADAVRAILERHPEAEGMSAGEIGLRVQRSRGQVARALAEDAEEIGRYREDLLELIGQIGFHRMDLLFHWSREMGKNRELPEIQKILEELLGLLRDTAVLQVGGGPETLINGDIAHRLAPLAARKPRAAVLSMMEAVFRTRNILNQNANVQLSLETMLMQFCTAA